MLIACEEISEDEAMRRAFASQVRAACNDDGRAKAKPRSLARGSVARAPMTPTPKPTPKASNTISVMLKTKSEAKAKAKRPR